ncbi:antibiotic biosynthesis monooxygenase family protein [Amycolatopsis regifaucium]|uniref:Antibiotic biosynthesis monooxygenase n=1 Tax=Amycolatopsis regifaucium TaxID=546365 RepID=A0A154MVK1_9PSEU|nr:antibiotic biosynthesis monooxygenase [Amycolatopsis regifaucium]KZB88326.1 antibiotic biosynthesis monooxygenase [Amycolatopsis regifaucium]OKA11438.1 antibiotic biosynthesis monooxygenase [Amycolatopsis regifaucium]SFH41844.1 Antibiotic biosynthesis monooxygenase [Amycolatopsis regifaucium]
MPGKVRVLLFHRTADGEGLRAAYRRTSEALSGTPGLLGNELLGSVHDSAEFIVISDWADQESFDAWETGASHRDSTAPLRPYRDMALSRPFGVYRVLDGFGEPY